MGISALTPPPHSEDIHETLLEFADNRLLIDLCGEFDRNLAQIEHQLGIHILRRGNHLALVGTADARGQAAAALQTLYARLETGRQIDAGEIDAVIRMGGDNGVPAPTSINDQLEMFAKGRIEIRTRKKQVEPRTEAQKAYVQNLFKHELAFGIGPAGTGKTYLAVAHAAMMLERGMVERIILSRPAVEAGERLGFLPGDMKEKVDPYLRPIYDALYDLMDAPRVERGMQSGMIEIAPLAFMRGRTLTNAVVILDEAQNTTSMQMKMFLTRLGENSRMIITGDPTQVDLPPGMKSGLSEALDLLDNVEGIAQSYFTEDDVVRHELVGRIVKAYDDTSRERLAAAAESPARTRS